MALIITLVLMMLLALVAVALLSLATVSSRATSSGLAMAQAKANARMALILALGRLQTETGPDQRITANAAIFDTSPDSARADGVEHPHWLGSWDSWGTWLNATYTNREGGKPDLKIQDTYDIGRTKMFRNWLVSGLRAPSDVSAAKNDSPFTDDFIRLAVARDSTESDEEREVRAGLVPIATSSSAHAGNLAWWVSGENLKADIRQSDPPEEIGPALAEASGGNARHRRFTEIPSWNPLPHNKAVAPKLISINQATAAGVTAPPVRQSLHDITADTYGLITDVRWGGLKKDLSLLFELGELPANLARNSTYAPGPRAKSADITALNPQIPERGFVSFEKLRSYSSQYKTGSTSSFTWQGTNPRVEIIQDVRDQPRGEFTKHLRRTPVILRQYMILGTRTEKVGAAATPAEQRYNCHITFAPVISLWNPYSVPLEIPTDVISSFVAFYKVFPIQYRKYKGNVANSGWIGAGQGNTGGAFGRDYGAKFKGDSGGSAPIRFKAGEIRIFSLPTAIGNSAAQMPPFVPGFDPSGASATAIRAFENVLSSEAPGVAVRAIASWAQDGTTYWFGGNPGGFCNLLNYSQKAWGLNVDWLTPGNGAIKSTEGTSISTENTSEMARWVFGDQEIYPFAVAGMTTKTSQMLQFNPFWKDNFGTQPFPGVTATECDWRNRTWIQSPAWFPTTMMLPSKDNRNLLESQRLDSPVQLHLRAISSFSELGQVFPHNGGTGMFGTDSPDGERVSAVVAAEFPSAPVQSLAAFAGMSLQPGWFDYSSYHVEEPKGDANNFWHKNPSAYRSGVPGVGIGNAFAPPMIPGNSIYKYHDVSKNDPNSSIDNGKTLPRTDAKIFSDYWDHALINNDGLWDSWFVSSLSDASRPTDNSARDLGELLSDTFEKHTKLPNSNFQPEHGTGPATVNELKAEDGYLKAAARLVNCGAFNVNSTSVDAWHALFSSLHEHKVVVRNESGSLSVVTPPEGKVAISRYQTELTGNETVDPRDSSVRYGQWSGVRFLSDDQLRKLAEECVKQVKRRGPFLNMSDFINRRLDETEAGKRGMLQAAIDWDEPTMNPSSINAMFKNRNDMISESTFTTNPYDFKEAAYGSRFTGAPGYVIQSDLLRPLGNAMTVRDDTFMIRAYGDSKDAAGKITARAWCEARVRRTPAFVSSENAVGDGTLSFDHAGNPSSVELKDINRRFGRSLELISFRWLTEAEL